MISCKFCNSIEVQVLSSDPYGDDVVIMCTNCEEIFEIDKEEMEQNERYDD